MRCLIVDDEHLARKLIATYLAKIPDIEIVGQAKNAMEAIQLLQTQSVDLLLLDIQMPDLTGLELLKTLAHQPFVVFTTAYSEHAVAGFELDAVDYLVKPVSFERFVQAINKVRARISSVANQAVENPVLADEKDHFFVKVDYKLVKVMYDQILYIEGMREYVALHTPGKRLIVYQSMKKLAEMLSARDFFRIHKSYIVSLNHIESVYGNVVQIAGKELPIGKMYKEAFMGRLEML
jgi:DNA-binding LytR/AlgR family response regulator